MPPVPQLNEMQSPDPRVAELVATGEIRLALFLPQYAKDAASGELRGIGTGFIATALIQGLAARLAIACCVIEYPSPAAAIVGLNGGACDVAFLGLEPLRAVEVDFTPPLFQFDYTFLVLPGSAIRELGDADRPGVRIVTVDGHASALALRRLVRHAELVGCKLPEEAFALFAAGQAQAFALPRDHLLEFAQRLPGSRLLADRYGVNRVGMAVRKGRAELLAYLSEFAEEARTSGLVQRVIDRGALPGFEVAAG